MLANTLMHLWPPARVLIVEDDGHLRRVIAAALARDGFDVFVAGTGLEAEAIMTIIAPTELDLVILDVHLDDRDGTEVLEKLRERRPDLSALFITSFPDHTLAEKIDRLNARLLAKPFSLDELGLATISALLAAPQAIS